MAAERDDVLQDARRRFDRIVGGRDRVADESSDHPEEVEWGELVLLEDQERASFPTRALPEIAAEFVDAVSEECQTPPDLAGVGVLAGISASVGGKFQIEIGGSWREPVHGQMFSAIESGNRKTGVYEHIIDPVQEYEREQAAEDRAELARWQARRDVKEATLKRMKGQAAEDDKPGKPRAADLDLQIEALAQELAADRKPHVKEIIASDITPERIPGVLAEQSGALAILSDEGGFYVNLAGRYSDLPNFEALKHAHAGSTIRVRRLGREIELVPRPALTIWIALQPSVIRQLGKIEAFIEEGVAARQWPSFPHSPVGYRRISTETTPAPRAVLDAWGRLIRRLLELKGSQRADHDGYPLPNTLTLSPEARRVHAQFEAWVEVNLRDDGYLGEIREWGSKLAGAAARIAGLLHLAEYAFNEAPHEVPVTAETMSKAVEIAQYFASHALVFHDVLEQRGDLAGARAVLKELVASGNTTKRDLFKRLSKQRRFKTVDDLTQPLSVLEDHNHIRLTKRATGGRPSVEILVNPEAQKGQKGQNDESITPFAPSVPFVLGKQNEEREEFEL